MKGRICIPWSSWYLCLNSYNLPAGYKDLLAPTYSGHLKLMSCSSLFFVSSFSASWRARWRNRLIFFFTQIASCSPANGKHSFSNWSCNAFSDPHKVLIISNVYFSIVSLSFHADLKATGKITCTSNSEPRTGVWRGKYPFDSPWAIIPFESVVNPPRTNVSLPLKPLRADLTFSWGEHFNRTRLLQKTFQQAWCAQVTAKGEKILL